MQCISCGKETEDLHPIPEAWDSTMQACSVCLSRWQHRPHPEGPRPEYSFLSYEADRLMTQWKPNPIVSCLKCGAPTVQVGKLAPMYCYECAQTLFAEFRKLLQ